MAGVGAGPGENTRFAAPVTPATLRPASALYLIFGWVAFVGLAYLPDFAPERSINAASMTLFWGFVGSTQITLCDQVTIALGRESLALRATGSAKAWSSFLCVGAIAGLLLDGAGQWLGKLWIYPYWNEAVYGATFVVGYCFYWLAIAESYLVVLAILRRRRLLPPITPKSYEPALFRMIGGVGIVVTIAAVMLILMDYSKAGGYVFEIRRRFPVKIHFGYFLAAFIGVWMILEWIQVRLGKLSLIRTLLHGRFAPLVAILIASLVCSLFWETVNASHHFWKYTNWPIADWQLLHVPIVIFLTWPVQYVVFLSLGFLLGRDLWG